MYFVTSLGQADKYFIPLQTFLEPFVEQFAILIPKMSECLYFVIRFFKELFRLKSSDKNILVFIIKNISRQNFSFTIGRWSFLWCFIFKEFGIEENTFLKLEFFSIDLHIMRGKWQIFLLPKIFIVIFLILLQIKFAYSEPTVNWFNFSKDILVFGNFSKLWSFL